MLQTYLVEDSPVIRQGLTALLEDVTEVEILGVADNETTALEWLAANGNQVDLAIIDIFLKSGSGLGVLREMAAQRLSCKVVVLTNYATIDMRQKCMALGANHVFDKSNDIDALVRYCNDLSGTMGGGAIQAPALTPLP